MKTDRIFQIWQHELERLDQDHLLRKLPVIESSPTGRILMAGREIILLASNNYLGLSTEPTVVKAAQDALDKYGTGASGSRLLSGNLDLYQKLEYRISALKETEAALVFSSGYQANLGLISTLCQADDLILSDALNHASIIDGCRLSKAQRLIYNHCDPDHLQDLLSNASTATNRWIITDGVFSMDGNLAPLPEILDLANRFDAYVIIDDAHGFGVLGTNGGGITSHFSLTDSRLIHVGTLSKAVGGLGGYVAGPQVLIDLLINQARSFIFTTGLPPSVIATAIAAIDLIAISPERRQRLLNHAEYLRHQLRQLGLQIPAGEAQIVPVIVGAAEQAKQLADQLLNLGLFAPAVRPPTVPPNTARLRLSPIATHTDADLQTVVQAFAACVHANQP
ncbi:MAG: 8-amino-7-oxononanoate synthase [Candidatus Poribacteria bacterium]|nr:8-amino-7-oxononanoate synthase [Candidatus Poribacteria bacterium]